MAYVARQTKDGFTLIEVLIAIAIVAIAGFMVVPYFTGQLEKAKQKTVRSTLRTLSGMIDQFEADLGQYPERLKDLVKRPLNDEIAKNWTQYLKGKEVQKDPWGKAFFYEVTPDGQNPYELSSYGNKKGKNTPRAEWISVWDL